MRAQGTPRRLGGLLISIGFAVALAATGAAQEISVVVNGEQVPFSQPPIEQGDRVFVPLRGVFERLGATVDYSAGTILANRGDTTVALHIGSNVAYVNGDAVTLDAAPFIVGSRTLVPLRFLSESLGAIVDWNQAQQTVYVDLTTAIAPPPAGWPPPYPTVWPPPRGWWGPHGHAPSGGGYAPGGRGPGGRGPGGGYGPGSGGHGHPYPTPTPRRTPRPPYTPRPPFTPRPPITPHPTFHPFPPPTPTPIHIYTPRPTFRPFPLPTPTPIRIYTPRPTFRPFPRPTPTPFRVYTPRPTLRPPYPRVTPTPHIRPTRLPRVTPTP